MISMVCFCSLLFGNWSLEWDKKNKKFKISRYFILSSLFMLIVILYLCHINNTEITKMGNKSTSLNPQIIIIYGILTSQIGLIFNRLLKVKQSRYFSNELLATCGRTVESGRYLPEFWLRIMLIFHTTYFINYKYQNSSDVFMNVSTVPVLVGCSKFMSSTMECQYTAACNVLVDEFTAINRQVRSVTGVTATAVVQQLSGAHCRLVRLVRLFNDEYGAPMFFTTIDLLLNQIFILNELVSMVVESNTLAHSFVDFAYFYDTFLWTTYLLRLCWICYRVDSLVDQVHLTVNILLEKDLNSFPDNTRKLALEFLNQLLHRHVCITALGFYNINKEFIFTILSYQFGLCLMCNQFTTSGLTNSINDTKNNFSSGVSSN